MRKFVYQVCYTRYQGSFYLWRIGPLTKHCKVPKCFDKDCVKIFLLFSALLMMFQISRSLKRSFGSKMLAIKKLPIIKVESQVNF